MSLVTRCPSCYTVFKVTPEQLQTHDGEVRCGRCAMVFNAFDNLATLEQPLVTQPLASASARTPAQVTQALASERAALQETRAASGFAESARQPAAMETQGTASAEELSGEISSEPPRRNWAWSAGAVLLFFALAGQAAYLYRTELSIVFPESRPYLTRYCDLLGCVVPLPQVREFVRIEGSELQEDPIRSNVVILTAILRNHAPFDQAYPYVELTLTDTQDQLLTRRVFSPAEYLDKKINREAGLAAYEEARIQLFLDQGELKAYGYRLERFYP